MTQLPPLSDTRRAARGKRPEPHDEPAIDRLISMVMALAGEVAVLRQRLDTVERVADANGSISRAEIEAFQADAETMQAQEAMRQEILANLFYWVPKDLRDIEENASAVGYQSSVEAIAADR